MKLSDVMAVLGAQAIGPLHDQDLLCSGVSTDTRTLRPGELFIALVGPRFNGHDFLTSAIEQGAVACVVSQEVTSIAAAVPLLRVADTTQALGALGHWWRNQWTMPVVAVTGSCGKTTTKAMIASILSHCGSVHVSPGSYNNAVGLPLTLLGVLPSHDYVVVELGTNYPCEISALTRIGRPTVAVITQAAFSHLEGLGSVAGVARAKAEIFEGLVPGGTAVINAEDDFADYWTQQVHDAQILYFGGTDIGAVRAENLQRDTEGYPSFTLVVPQGKILIRLPLLGLHNVQNALAAAAAAVAAGASLSAIQAGLASVSPVPGRLFMQYFQLAAQPNSKRLRVIDDSYNANPTSTKVALALLADYPGYRVLVMGDMGELGAEAEQHHRAIGEQARALNIDVVYACGALTAAVVEAFGVGAYHFATLTDLIAILREHLRDFPVDTTVLVKGSRFMQMEQVISECAINSSTGTVS